MKKDVLGVKIDDITLNESVQTVENWLLASQGQALRGCRYIVTPNPEFIVAAQSDPSFKKILNDADLSIPDGIGLKLFGGVKNRVSGVDLMEKLIEKSAERGFMVGFLGGSEGVAAKTAERLKTRYPGLKVAFADSGGEVDGKGSSLGVLPVRDPAVHPRSTSLAAASRREPFSLSPLRLLYADLLFVAFGQVKQEKWIAQNLDKLPVKVVIGVGGAFDYLSGEVARAPRGLRNLGLEWLFRLVTQPWRIKRQLKLLKFLELVMLK